MIQTDPTKPIDDLNPHYTISRFKTAQTVYCKDPSALTKGALGDFYPEAFYEYSDRLVEWDREKTNKATNSADEQGLKRGTAEWYSAYLSAYYGKPVEAVHILAGYNLSNGFPYRVYGTIDR